MSLSRPSFAALAFTLVSSCLCVPSSHAQPPILQAGFERLVTDEGLEVGVWYPSRGTPVPRPMGLSEQGVVSDVSPSAGLYPLIVLSHGTGGDFAGHADTAVALARAGFVAAAVTHPGDNWRDNSRATRIEDRPRALTTLITHMTTAWAHRAVIDPDRIGAFGFSAGGFTVLTAAGGQPDMSRLAGHCADHPDFFDCRLLASSPRTERVPWPDVADARIKAIVVAAPALGFTFDRTGLESVGASVQLWRADDDEILPAPVYADAVHDALPGSHEFHAVPSARHFDFLAPCRPDVRQPVLCDSAPGFDRRAFHADFNDQIVRFFDRTLRRSIADDDTKAPDAPAALVE